DHARHHQQGRGVHARALRRHHGAVREERHLGLGVVVVQEPRRVHPGVGVPALQPGGEGRHLPAAEDAGVGQVRPQDLQRRRHDHRGRPRPVPREDGEVPRARRRPAHLLRAVRLPAARVGHAHHRAVRHRADPQAGEARDPDQCDDGRQQRQQAQPRQDGQGHRLTRTDDTEVPDYPGKLRLDGKNFVVIGAGQGIGRQATHALASVGANTMCVDLDADLAADIAKEVDGIAWSGDATKRPDAERLFTDAEAELGRIDGVVDIIGMARYTALLDIDDELWDWEHDIVLRHAFHAMQYGGRAMSKTGGGAMVFVASVSGRTSAPLHSAYGAFKAALMGLVQSAAVELGPKGIRVNAVAPGMVWTPRVSQYVDAEGKKKNEENTPLRRVALPADIAAAILFLASDLAGYVSGQTLIVDGGVTAKFPYPMPGV